MTSSADVRRIEQTAGSDLVAAVDRVLAEWIDHVLRSRVPGPAREAHADAWTSVVTETHRRVVTDLTDLLGHRFDEQATSPLAVLRGVVPPLTEFLRRVGVEPVPRDDAAMALHPDDAYDLTPGAFADFGDEVAEAGLRWGAAKAFVHLRSRADAPSGEA